MEVGALPLKRKHFLV